MNYDYPTSNGNNNYNETIKDSKYYMSLNPFISENATQNKNIRKKPSPGLTILQNDRELKIENNDIRPYNFHTPIRIQDLKLQKVTTNTSLNDKIAEKIMIDNIKTYFYLNGECYNEYYGWVKLNTIENGTRNIREEFKKTKELRNKTLTIFSLLVVLSLFLSYSSLPDYLMYLTMAVCCFVPMIHIMIKKQIIKSRKQFMIDMFYNGEIREESENLRLKRLEMNKRDSFNDKRR